MHDGLALFAFGILCFLQGLDTLFNFESFTFGLHYTGALSMCGNTSPTRWVGKGSFGNLLANMFLLEISDRSVIVTTFLQLFSVKTNFHFAAWTLKKIPLYIRSANNSNGKTCLPKSKPKTKCCSEKLAEEHDSHFPMSVGCLWFFMPA